MRRHGFTIVELLVSIAIVSLLLALLLPGVQSAREASRRTSCLNNLKQLITAEQAYESGHGHFPDTDFWHGNPPRPATFTYASHHLRLLPYLDQAELYNRVNMDAWDDQHVHTSPPDSDKNRNVMFMPIPVFRCPSDFDRVGANNYRVCAGTTPGLHEANGSTRSNRALLGFGTGHSQRENGGYYLKMREITDGVSQTIAISERVVGHPELEEPFSKVYLAVPADFYLPDESALNCQKLVGSGTPSYTHAGATWLYGGYPFSAYNHVTGPNSPIVDCTSGAEMSTAAFQGVLAARSRHPGGVHGAMVDGSARFFSNSISLEVWRSLGSIAGDEVVGEF